MSSQGLEGRRGRRPGPTRRGLGWPSLPGKYGHGVPLAPRAEELAEAFLRLDGNRALRQLVSMHEQGHDLDDIESNALEPALTKVGELWVRGRVDDAWFDDLSLLAQSVERQFRLAIAVEPVQK